MHWTNRRNEAWRIEQYWTSHCQICSKGASSTNPWKSSLELGRVVGLSSHNLESRIRCLLFLYIYWFGNKCHFFRLFFCGCGTRLSCRSSFLRARLPTDRWMKKLLTRPFVCSSQPVTLQQCAGKRWKRRVTWGRLCFQWHLVCNYCNLLNLADFFQNLRIYTHCKLWYMFYFVIDF